ncbi:hypothetical protein A1OS_01440 [Enterovibrio norvegicus]|uniref:DUF2970 domain-containing protein n=1 Tax=Enterovibrio norvegicus TaxID=188144 RepID=UPI0002EE108E|nr:DUF2970 domain-containing protein [Enterovibrio norvegicus]OEE45720.1 hypothetical protein A1OS_01440 [Enterovibrio norvegicus]
MPNTDNNKENVGFIDIVKSVFAAMFGVQSDKNRQRDFKQSSMVPYIVVGVVFVVLFVLGLMSIVSVVISA